MGRTRGSLLHPNERPVAILPAALAVLLVVGGGCGSAAAGGAEAPGSREVRIAGIEPRERLTVASAIRLAREYELVVAEITAVQRGGEEEITSGFFPDPRASPEEAERRFREEDPAAELGRDDLPPEQRKNLEEAKKQPPVVRDFTVCGPRDVLFEFENDPAVKSMVVAPRDAVEDCPEAALDSNS